MKRNEPGIIGGSGGNVEYAAISQYGSVNLSGEQPDGLALSHLSLTIRCGTAPAGAVPKRQEARGTSLERDLSVIKSRTNGAPVSLLRELANHPEVLAPVSSLHARLDVASAGSPARRSL